MCFSSTYPLDMKTESLSPLRRIGILGGMGPAATVDLMQKIIDLTPAQCDQEHVPLVVWNVPQIPSRLAAIHESGESPVDAMCEGARWLAQAGAEAIAIACNTAHHWAEDVARASGRPVLHIADSAIHALKSRPESQQRRRRNGEAELRQITLQKGVDELLTPDEAVGVRAR